MKVNIINENKIISTKLAKNTKIRDLLFCLRNSENFQNISKSKSIELLLMDENSKFVNEEEIIKVEDKVERNFYLITKPIYKKAEEKVKFDLEEAITEVTGAKEKLKKIKKKERKESGSTTDFMTERLRLLEQMTSSLGVLQSNNPLLQNRVSEINHFRDILQNMMSELPRRVTNVQAQTQVVADEILVAQLKEMGFPEDSCRRALVMARNNVSRATDLLINDELDYVQNEEIHQEEEEADI